MRRQLMAKIHIAKKDLALDEDTYRQALQGSAGKASCSDMSVEQLEKVLSHFIRLGWKPKKSNSRRYSPKTRHEKGHDQLDVIRAIWISMYKSGAIDSGTEAALDAWVQRTTTRMNKGVGIARAEWLRGKGNRQLLVRVLESLKQWQTRVTREWMNEDLRKVSVEQKRCDQSQAIVVQKLLKDRRIFWWPLFNDLGLRNSGRYCTNRKALNHG